MGCPIARHMNLNPTRKTILSLSKGRYRLAALVLIAALTASSIASGGPIYAADPTQTPAPAVGNATIHVVQRGDTLFRIAQQYGTSVDSIVQANALRDASQLQIGQRLLIPNTGQGAAPAPTDIAPASAASAASAAPGTVPKANVDPGSAAGIPVKYVVQPGHSLFNLSWPYSMDLDALA